MLACVSLTVPLSANPSITQVALRWRHRPSPTSALLRARCWVGGSWASSKLSWHSRFITKGFNPAYLTQPRLRGCPSGTALCKLLKTWSGRWDSNPRRPAWEVGRHFNFRHLESAGVGLESTERPGKTVLHRERPLNGVQLECSGAKRPTARFTRSIWNIDRNSPRKRLLLFKRVPAPWKR
jgi:hypothetical protein